LRSFNAGVAEQTADAVGQTLKSLPPLWPHPGKKCGVKREIELKFDPEGLDSMKSGATRIQFEVCAVTMCSNRSKSDFSIPFP
jgi:hypothetical protein